MVDPGQVQDQDHWGMEVTLVEEGWVTSAGRDRRMEEGGGDLGWLEEGLLGSATGGGSSGMEEGEPDSDYSDLLRHT